MAKCWQERGCDEEMQAECPHSAVIKDRCPSKCAFAACDRETHSVTTDPELVFSATIERDAAIKDNCLFCGFFLTHGPRRD